MTNIAKPTEAITLKAWSERELLKLDDARSGTIYGGLSPFAIFGPAHDELKKGGLIQSFVPEGGMGLITKLTPKGRKAAAKLRVGKVEHDRGD